MSHLLERWFSVRVQHGQPGTEALRESDRWCELKACERFGCNEEGFCFILCGVPEERDTRGSIGTLDETVVFRLLARRGTK